MNVLKNLTWLACALCAHAAAHAATVQLVVDVTHVSKSTGVLVGKAAAWTDDTGPTPQDFSLTLRFDLDQRQVSATHPGAGADIVTWYPGGQLSASRYGASLLPLLPAEATALSYEVSYHQSPGGRYAGDTLVAGAGDICEDAAGSVFRMRTYSRTLEWKQATPFSADYSAAPGDQAFVQLLRAHEGRSLGRYSEFYAVDTFKVPPFSGGATLDDWLSFDGVIYSGDAVIRSVTVVPEPAGAPLALAGLLGMAAVLRRRTGPQAN